MKIKQAAKLLLGYTEPRLFTKPLRKLTPKTSLGFAAIEYANVILHKKLYPWQEWALIHALEIVGDLEKKWRFRFRIQAERKNGFKRSISIIFLEFPRSELRFRHIFVS